MNCPVCRDSVLRMSERQSIEIDYCPDCRGVWLDHGELDKIIERSSMDYEKDNHIQRRHHKKDYRTQPKKKKSFFSEIFDF